MTRARNIRNLLPPLLALLVGLIFVSPILWMISASLKPEQAIHENTDSLRSFVPAPFTTQHYPDAVERGDLGIVLLNTVIVVILVSGVGLLVNAPAAYAFARMRFPGRDILFMFVVATMIVPLEAIVIPLFLTVRLTRDLTAIMGEHAWTLGALSAPFMAKAFNIFLLRQSFLSLPRTLEEAAFLDGASWFGVFTRVALPNIRHTVITVVILDCVIHWSDFLWPLVICQEAHTRTIQLGLDNFFTQPPITWGAIMAYATIATLPIAVVFLGGQRWIVRSLVSSGIRE